METAKDAGCEIMIFGIEFPVNFQNNAASILGRDTSSGKQIFFEERTFPKSYSIIGQGQTATGGGTVTIQYDTAYSFQDRLKTIDWILKDFKIQQ